MRSGGPVVELGVGTGRIAVPIAAAGIPVIGVDPSAGMLAVARERAELGRRRPLDLRHGDLRDPPVEGAFPLVLIPFRSLLHMETDADRRAALRAVRGAARTRTAASSSTSSRRRRGHRRDARPLARARAGDLGARRLGRATRGR